MIGRSSMPPSIGAQYVACLLYTSIEQAMQPFYTTQPDQERTGMGFALMQSFMDSVRVQSSPGNGTLVFMQKRLHENDE